MLINGGIYYSVHPLTHSITESSVSLLRCLKTIAYLDHPPSIEAGPVTQGLARAMSHVACPGSDLDYHQSLNYGMTSSSNATISS
jgi:hypothetical protein